MTLIKTRLKQIAEGLKTFIDTCEEWHAVVEGFCEVICPWPARYHPSHQLLNDLRAEHHYYMFGRALGILGWIAICSIIKGVFF
jgi:hypothetical protein